MITHGTNHFCMSCGFDAHPGDNVEELKIDADWFSGTIRIHIPDLEHYHDFFANDKKVPGSFTTYRQRHMKRMLDFNPACVLPSSSFFCDANPIKAVPYRKTQYIHILGQ